MSVTSGAGGAMWAGGSSHCRLHRQIPRNRWLSRISTRHWSRKFSATRPRANAAIADAKTGRKPVTSRLRDIPSNRASILDRKYFGARIRIADDIDTLRRNELERVGGERWIPFPLGESDFGRVA